MKNILVVGGTGYLGYHLLKTLSKLNFSLFSISLHVPKKKRKIKNVNYYVCDYTDQSQLKNIKSKFDYIVNTSGYFFSEKNNSEKKNYNHHFDGLKNLVNQFSSNNLKKFLHIGSSLEYGICSKLCKENMRCKPSTHYGKIKLKCTKYLISLFKKKRYPICVVRLFSLYGGNQNKGLIFKLLKFIKSKEKKDFVIDYKILDLSHIDDIIDGIVQLLFSKKIKGEVFNLASGNKISTSQIKDLIQEKIDKTKYNTNNIKIIYNGKPSICPDLSKINNKIRWSPQKNLIKEINKLLIKDNIL